MTLQDLGSVGEVVGALAVLVSLVYLAIQIREGTRQQTRAAIQTLLATEGRLVVDSAASPELAHAVIKASFGSKLDDREVAMFGLWLYGLLISAEQMHYTVEEYDLSPEVRESQELRLAYVLQSPVAQAVWEMHKGRFRPGFQRYVSSVIERHQGRLVPPPQ